MSIKKKCTIIFIVILAILLGKVLYDSYQLINIYEAAVVLVDEEYYQEAYEKLHSIQDERYRDTLGLISYCEANVAYINGDIQAAHDAMCFVNFKYQTTKQNEKIDAFKDKIEREFDEYLEEQRLEERRAYLKKVSSGVPFVGMYESDINSTILGKASSEIRHNYECINGKQYLANLYDFYNDSGKIFSARCVQGKVTEVWDYRDNPAWKESKSYSSSGSNNSDDKEKEDPYGASDCSHPDDFYYDYYDDFYDYEEAEEYWYEYS